MIRFGKNINGETFFTCIVCNEDIIIDKPLAEGGIEALAKHLLVN